MSSSSSSSSKSKPQWIHDVFLSFRGKDTRKNFVSHLYSSLSNSGINTFRDDEKLHKGTKLGPELLRAIEGSQISIVVFSQNYANSMWCLLELDKIMECQRINGQIVIPIFYDVEPCEVRHQKGVIEKGLQELAVKYSEMMSGWKRALNQAASLIGWDVTNCWDESDLIDQIVDDILRKLDNTYVPITDFPVGLESRVQDVIQLLKGQSNILRIVGIWGMGGIGKTTIAKAIYNKIHRKFVYRSFLENMREVCGKDRGQIDLQKQLILDTIKTKVKIHSVASGTAIIEKRLYGKRVLVVLDDVNKFEQLKALFGNRK